MSQLEAKTIGEGLIELGRQRSKDGLVSSDQVRQASSYTLTDERAGEGDPDCELCGGIGWLESDQSLSIHHRDFGKLIICACLRERDKLRRLNAFSNIPAGLLYESMTLESWEREREPGAYAAVLAIAEGKTPPVFLILQGGPGLGKTHLAIAAVRHSIARDEPARFVYVPDLLAELRSLMNNETVRPDDWLELYASVALLALDDFGVENAASGWVREQLDMLINRRHSRGLRTIVTTNLSVNEIPRRIYDRLFDQRFSAAFTFSGTSYRSGEQV